MAMAPRARSTLMPPRAEGGDDGVGEGGWGGRWLLHLTVEEGTPATHGITMGSGAGSTETGISTTKAVRLIDAGRGMSLELSWGEEPLMAVALSWRFGIVTEDTSWRPDSDATGSDDVEASVVAATISGPEATRPLLSSRKSSIACTTIPSGSFSWRMSRNRGMADEGPRGGSTARAANSEVEEVAEEGGGRTG